MSGSRSETSGPGERSIRITANSGIANTGDNPRFIHLDLGSLKPPQDVPADGFWSVPRRPSRVFVGRERAMDQVAAALKTNAFGAIGQSVAGLGGVGKTEVALHHAHTYRHRYTGVWWITADSPTNLTTGLAALAHRLMPAISVLPDEQAETWATAWLHHNSGWLLVLDNVEDPSHITALLGGIDGGHVLVTTRRDIDWNSHGLTPIRLGPLSQAEAVHMLRERTQQDDRGAAIGIGDYLGYLPLALEQAAAFINHHCITLTAYHQRLRDKAGSLLAGTAPGKDAQRAVTRVWEITLNALIDDKPAAVDVLRVLAWLAPDDIPRDLITTLTNGDQTDADIALGLLSSYSMITLDTDTVSIHRLVQAVLRLAPTEPAATDDPSRQAIYLLNNAVPDNPEDDPAGWPRWRSLLPHITALTDYLPLAADITVGLMLNRIALFERSQGLFQQAEVHNTQALAIAKAALGPDHPTVATSLGNLASSYVDLGRPAEAVPLQQQALAIAETALGPGHRTVATWLGNLAASYLDLGQAAEAVPLQQRALTITETVFGPDHPEVATCLGNLAASYFALGHGGKAVPLFQRALTITETALGPDHPTVATCLGNLAGSYRDLGRPAEAVPLQQRALTITQAALGPDHPNIATWLGNLATSYRALGRAGEAAQLQQRALTISETVFGPDHPDVATWLGNLATSYLDLGRAGEAVPLFQRALTITETALGPHHRAVAICLGNLATSYRDLGGAVEAVPLQQRALMITETVFGPDHPDVATCLGNLATSYFALGRAVEAVPLFQRALTITETALGPDHPTVAVCLGNLAFSHTALGRAGEAIPLQQRALTITETALGPDHPTVAICLGNLATSYRALSRPGDAAMLCRRAVQIADKTLADSHPTTVSLNDFLRELEKEADEGDRSG